MSDKTKDASQEDVTSPTEEAAEVEEKGTKGQQQRDMDKMGFHGDEGRDQVNEDKLGVVSWTEFCQRLPHKRWIRTGVTDSSFRHLHPLRTLTAKRRFSRQQGTLRRSLILFNSVLNPSVFLQGNRVGEGCYIPGRCGPAGTSFIRLAYERYRTSNPPN